MSLRLDSGRLDAVERTPQGGIRVKATLTRVGVFPYLQPDGSVRREYRAPEDVFHPDALASLRGAPVTNMHPPNGRVDSSDWTTKAIGHVGEDVQVEGQAVSATVYVQDSYALSLIEAGEREEVSCGYDQVYVPGAGVSPEGEPYDGRQTRFKYNHVALVQRARQGREVRLRLDAQDNQVLEEEAPVKIKIQGVEYEAGTPEAQERLDALESQLALFQAAAKVARRDALAEKVKSRGYTVRADADESGIMLETVKQISPELDTNGKDPMWIEGAFAALLSMVLPKPAAAPKSEPSPSPAPELDSEEEELEPTLDSDDIQPDGLEASMLRRALQESRKSRLDSEEFPDAELSSSERARLRMIDRGRKGVR